MGRVWPGSGPAAAVAPSGVARACAVRPGWRGEGRGCRRLRRGEAGIQARITSTARAPPTTWAAMKLGTEDGAMPAKVSENIRPTVMAGLAKLVEDVKKYAAPI